MDEGGEGGGEDAERGEGLVGVGAVDEGEGSGDGDEGMHGYF